MATIAVTYTVDAMITIEAESEHEARQILIARLKDQQDDVDYNGMSLYINSPMHECDIKVHLIEGPED